MKQFDVDVMWLEAMEEIDEVEADFWETLNGETTNKQNENTLYGGTGSNDTAPDYS